LCAQDAARLLAGRQAVGIRASHHHLPCALPLPRRVQQAACKVFCRVFQQTQRLLIGGPLHPIRNVLDSRPLTQQRKSRACKPRPNAR
jgi:hypothetical protein